MSWQNEAWNSGEAFESQWESFKEKRLSGPDIEASAVMVEEFLSGDCLPLQARTLSQLAGFCVHRCVSDLIGPDESRWNRVLDLVRGLSNGPNRRDCWVIRAHWPDPSLKEEVQAEVRRWEKGVRTRWGGKILFCRRMLTTLQERLDEEFRSETRVFNQNSIH